MDVLLCCFILHSYNFSGYMSTSGLIATYLRVAIDGVWISEWIYWPIIQTTLNYKHFRVLPLISTLYSSLEHDKSSQFSVVLPWQRIITVSLQSSLHSLTFKSQLNSLPFLLNHLRLPSHETPSIIIQL
jgi:hypothetical protein